MFQLADLDFLLWSWKTEHHSILSEGKLFAANPRGFMGLKKHHPLGLSEMLSLLVDPMDSSKCQHIFFLVGGWTNPSEK